MKQMITNIKKLGFFSMLLFGLTACNKEGDLTKAVSIQVQGYNIGNTELEVSIDELAYDKFRTQPDHLLNFAKVYTHPAGKSQALLKIKDVTSGKEVYQQQLKFSSAELELFFPFVLINGSPLEIKPPAADPSTNKLAFYIHYPQSSDAIDIFLQNEAGQIAYIAKNVQPATWIYADFMITAEFKDLSKAALYFTKTGSTDLWAFNDSQQMSKTPAGGTLLLPKFAEKGLACTYFITPGSNQLDAVRLFKGSE